MPIRECRWRRILGGFAMAWAVAGCSSEECSTEKCSSGSSYQSCLDGDDFVVKSASGDEYSRCTTDYEKIGDVTGEDKNGCKDKHAASKVSYCASHGGGSVSSGGMSSSSGGSASATPSSGKAYCYKANDNSTCVCQNTDVNPGAGFAKVTSCSAASGLVEPICCASDSPVTQCNCTSKPKACRDDGSRCSCPEAWNDSTRGSLAEVVSSCTKSGGEVCCLSDTFCACGPEQYAGAGCTGYGAVNESPVEVVSCTAPAKPIEVCGGRPELKSCDGLAWQR